MIKIKDSKNTVISKIQADGNVIVGDGNNITTTHLREAAQYRDLAAEIKELDKSIFIFKGKIKKYPDDEDFKAELVIIKKRHKHKKKNLESLKQQVLELAEEIKAMPEDTKGLRLIKQNFNAGKYTNTRILLNYLKASEAIIEMKLEFRKKRQQRDELLDKIDVLQQEIEQIRINILRLESDTML